MCPANAIKQAKGIKENGRMPEEMLRKGHKSSAGKRLRKQLEPLGHRSLDESRRLSV